MTNLSVWPAELPAGLRDLPAEVGGILGLEATAVADPAAAAAAPDPLLVVVADAAAAGVLAALDAAAASRTAPAVVVVSDGVIGTDGGDLAAALAGASAVTLVRSVAVRRSATGRINAVAVPDRLFGAAGSQRGPLPLEIASADVADVVAFLLSDESPYIDGQVLYADGGRQLFSSLTA